MEIIHDSVYLFGLTERKYYFRVFSICIHESLFQWFKNTCLGEFICGLDIMCSFLKKLTI